MQLTSYESLTFDNIIFKEAKYYKVIDSKIKYKRIPIEVLHAISPISLKLGQFKGSTPKLKMTNWCVVWICLVGDGPHNWFN